MNKLMERWVRNFSIQKSKIYYFNNKIISLIIQLDETKHLIWTCQVYKGVLALAKAWAWL